MNDTTNKTDANTAKRAEFLYDVKTGNWTGYVHRHEGTHRTYDLCDTSRGNAFHWERYIKAGFWVSVRNMTAYDEDHAGVGGGPMVKREFEDLNYELGDDKKWTGRLVNKRGTVFYDMRAAFKQNEELAALWVRTMYDRLASFDVSSDRMVVVAPTPLTDLVGFYTEDRSAVTYAPSEQVVRRTTPVTRLTWQESEQATDKILRMAKHPRERTYSVILRDGVPDRVFLDGIEVSDQFKDTERTRAAFYVRAAELGGDSVVWSDRTPEEKKNYVPKVVDDSETGHPGTAGAGPDPVLDEMEPGDDVEWVSKQEAVHDVKGVDQNRPVLLSAEARSVFEKQTADVLYQELLNAGEEVRKAEAAMLAAKTANDAAEKKVAELAKKLEAFQAMPAQLKTEQETLGTAMSGLDVSWDVGPDHTRAYVRVTHTVLLAANLELVGFEGLSLSELRKQVLTQLYQALTKDPVKYGKKMSLLSEHVASIDCFTGLHARSPSANTPLIRLENK